MPRLRQLLAAYPELYRRYGDLARQAAAAWAELSSGPNLHLREALLARAEALRAELAGPGASPLERLLVDRVFATWMQLAYFDSVEPLAIADDESPRLAIYWARRQRMAHAAHLSALGALTTFRRLMPPPGGATVAAVRIEAVVATAPAGAEVVDPAVVPGPGLPAALQHRLAGLVDRDGAQAGLLPVAMN